MQLDAKTTALILIDLQRGVLAMPLAPHSAYLATSPGGLDSVAIIAASSPHVDLSFVLALQSVRLLLVISSAPLITRLVVRHSPHLQGAGAD
jgi:uncharacterized membrane protein AbrB (regulator of aidB expression)